jgi:iron complex transport system permease protein
MSNSSALSSSSLAEQSQRITAQTTTRQAKKRSKGFWLLFGLSLFLLLSIVVSLAVGAVAISPQQVLAIFASWLGVDSLPWGLSNAWEYNATQQTVLESIRAPRVLLGVFVGAGLAISGATMQGFFRNPLADPALIGISSGAALAAVSVIVLGASYFSGFMDKFGLYALPLAAFSGGLVTTFIVYFFSKGNGKTVVATMLLVGIAINAIAGAATGLLTYMADDAQLRTLTFWSMGSLAGGGWENLKIVIPLMLIPIVLLPLYANALNAILLGESEAMHLGFNLEKIKREIIILVAFCVGVSVSIAGIIGFVGLVVPHILRLLFGPDHRWLLPASALLGASLLLWADLLARTVVVPAELPIGIITAILGGPFFLWILYKPKGQTR